MAALYRAADVMVVTPFADGMNLVAKEYVTCRLGNDGALVLSEFAGASDELKQAYLVNPHDINGVKRRDARGDARAAAREVAVGCGRCASRCASTTSTPGPSVSSTTSRAPGTSRDLTRPQRRAA